ADVAPRRDDDDMGPSVLVAQGCLIQLAQQEHYVVQPTGADLARDLGRGASVSANVPLELAGEQGIQARGHRQQIEDPLVRFDATDEEDAEGPQLVRRPRRYRLEQ